MSDAVTIYHNPRCSKSRETLALLQSNGIEPQVVLYLETPPDADTLRTLLSQLGMRSARKRSFTKRWGWLTARSVKRHYYRRWWIIRS